MAYTEKVSISGTALSFLLYECVNSQNSQEGFLIGDVTSEVTNHISDSQSDNARLDTQIVIRTVIPLPSVALFYFPTGRIKENTLSDLLSNSASEIVGWYKYRKDSNVKPTFRDKLISKGLQKYFEKHHGKKNFVTCNLSSKTSSASSTHTFTYRFGKINCFDMYEYVEDVTANLGEKPAGYRKPLRVSPHSIFNKIVKDSNVENNTSGDAILHIQEAVNARLMKEAKIAAKNESTIRELEADIKQMNTILSDKLFADLLAAHEKNIEQKFMNRDVEMARACVEAMQTPTEVDLLKVPNILITQILSDGDNALVENNVKARSTSPVLVASSSTKPVLNYASALKGKTDKPSTSKSQKLSEDLISFDVEENHVQKINFSDEVKCIGDSSPDY